MRERMQEMLRIREEFQHKNVIFSGSFRLAISLKTCSGRS
jgi:hypothetical protein